MARGSERYWRDYSTDRAGSETELLKCLNRGTIQQRVSSALLDLNGFHLSGGHVHIDHEYATARKMLASGLGQLVRTWGEHHLRERVLCGVPGSKRNERQQNGNDERFHAENI